MIVEGARGAPPDLAGTATMAHGHADGTGEVGHAARACTAARR